MKIGVTFIGYQCAETLDKVFEVFQDRSKLIDEYIISAVHCCFPETFQLKFPIKSTDGTEEKLKQYAEKGIIQRFISFSAPVHEANAWSSNLPFLYSRDIDILMMLNGDEIWASYELNCAGSFIKNNKSDIFNVHFKNYVGNDGSYMNEFLKPRFWRANSNGGINRFYRDELVEFNNSKADYQTNAVENNVPNILIPNLRPKHYSWGQVSDETLKRKIAFQKVRYKCCSYKWNEELNNIEFDSNYYLKLNQPIPLLYK